MNTRTISTGLIGGALAAFALNLPLHRILPTAYVPGWEAIPGFLGWAGYVCAALLVVVAGYCAARLSWAAGTGEALGAGAFSGALAGLVAFLLSGASAAGLSGSAPVLYFSNQSIVETIDAVYLFGEAITRISWNTYLTLAALVTAGALAGTLGAGLHVARHGDNWLDAPQPFSEGVRFLFALTLFLVSGSTYLVLEVLLAAMPEVDQIGSLQVLLWGRLHLPVAGVRMWPQALTLVVMLLTLWYVAARLTRWLRHPDETVRKSARLITAFALIFGLAVYVFLFMALSNLERISITLLLLVTGIGAAAANRKRRKIPRPDSDPFITPRDWIQGLTLAPLLAAQVLVGGGVIVWQALQSNVLPFLPGLMGNTAAAPIDLAANTQTYFSTHTELVARAVLYAILAWALVVWPIGWLFSRAAQRRFYPYDEDEESEE